MILKRKRQAKRRLSFPDDDKENTFINNSDYLNKTDEEAVEEELASNNESNPFVDHNKEEVNVLTNEPILENIEEELKDKLESLNTTVNNGDDIHQSEQEKSISIDKISDQEVPNKEVPKQTRTTLNFSEQQAEINLSPSKNREAAIPKTNVNIPRLVIDKLVLTNFKSYAGVQVIGPFNASFSAVVGPNGSGKSNVIDSMLFVFGFRALKMRQGKLSELIHNSSGGERLDYCQVDIHFQNVIDDPEDPQSSTLIENSELVISRKAFKNNSSQYYINGKNSTYTEVTNFLRDKGIDLDHKRFLILQGEVESIAQMKAKAERENDDGLLEYLEDIIGTKKYKVLIEENLEKVQELNEMCLEKENRFELVEKDKELLEDKKEEALKFLKTEKKLIAKKSIQYQANIISNSHIVRENKEIATGIEEKLRNEKLANEEINKGIVEYLEKQKSIKEEVDSISEQIKNLNQKQKIVNRANVSIGEKIKNLNTKLQKLNKTKEQLTTSLSTSKTKLENNNQSSLQYKSELNELIESLELEKNKLDEIRSRLKDKTANFTLEIEELQKKLDPWNEKVKEKDNSIQLINSSIEMLEHEKDSISKQIEGAKSRFIEIKSEGKQMETEHAEAKIKLQKIIESISIGEEKCLEKRKVVDEERNKLSLLRQKTADSVKSLSNNQNKNLVLTSLLRLSKSGRISGFYGRLGDLGVIDDKYDIAISTACPGLDSLVVETVETAQSCIDYLRKNKLGYANFICLNKLRQFNLSPIQTPGNPSSVKRLFDLIKPLNPKFAPAFYSKLYNTLVATNLLEARSVAYGPKRWKVVTLDGKVVDTSGTMSGGGSYVSRGSMRLTSAKSTGEEVSLDDVENMKAALEKEEGAFELLRREFQEMEAQLLKLKDLKPETEFNISKLELSIQALSSEKKQVSATFKNLIAENESKNTFSELDNQIQQKTIEKQKLTDEKAELQVHMSALESQIKSLEEKIMEAGGVELRLQNSKVDSIKQKMEIINDKIANDKISTKKLENDIRRHTKVIAESEEELESILQELEKIKLDQGIKVNELDDLKSKLEALSSQKDAQDIQLEEISEVLEERRNKINELKSTEIELENQLEKHNSIIRKHEKYIKLDNENLSALVVRDPTSYIYWLNEKDQQIYNSSEIEQLEESQLANINMDEVNNEIEELESYMRDVKVDIEVLKEYGVKMSEFETRRNDLNKAIEQRDELKSYCEELKRKRLDEFMEGFNTISMSLKEMYQMITMGGNAELELVDSLDPFAEGILFSVMPPKKSWRNISNLSGGEKTLSSLALVFALHKYKPTPLYVMDEIDAALDFRNVSIVANYIKERTKNAQFIVISLRNNMFELAQQLVGIYKVNNMTKSISLQNKEFINNS